MSRSSRLGAICRALWLSLMGFDLVVMLTRVWIVGVWFWLDLMTPFYVVVVVLVCCDLRGFVWQFWCAHLSLAETLLVLDLSHLDSWSSRDPSGSLSTGFDLVNRPEVIYF